MLYDLMKDYNEQGRVLLKAASYIEEHGHTKGALCDAEGRVCLLGALMKVDDEDRYVSTCVGMVREKVGMYEIEWNNAPERTAEEVINILRKCAEDCKIIA